MTNSNGLINSRRGSAAAYSTGVSSGRVEREPRGTSHRMHLSFLVDGFPTRDAAGSPQASFTHAPTFRVHLEALSMSWHKPPLYQILLLSRRVLLGLCRS
jgi:hypothetical protein